MRVFGLLCGGAARDVKSGQRRRKKEEVSAEEMESNFEVLRCLMSLLEEKYLKRDGLFRVPGNSEAINEAASQLDAGDDPRQVIASIDADEGADALASLLKKWTGKLRMTQAPSELIDFLAKVADESESNRMPARNLATVFGPIFAPPPTPTQPYDQYVREVLSPSIEQLARAIQDAQERNFDQRTQQNIHLRESPGHTNGFRPLKTTKTHTTPSIQPEIEVSNTDSMPDNSRQDGSLDDQEEEEDFEEQDRHTIEVALHKPYDRHSFEESGRPIDT